MPQPTTFSIVAADPRTNEIGIAVQSKFLSVGAAVPWVEGAVGGVATQAWANTTFGPRGLRALRDGAAPDDVLRALLADDPQAQDRQVGIVDAQGRAVTFTGERCIGWAGGVAGDGFAAQGNCLAGAAVVDALAATFRGARGTLSDRLVAALAAAQRAGGDKRGQQSAALVVAKPGGGYGGFNDRYVDLRVDDHAAPIDELARILELHKLYFFPPAPEDVLVVDDALGRTLVRELVRLGELPAGASAYDQRARDALVALMHVENLENRVRDDGTIDRQTLDYLTALRRG
ncbi:MAG TPA: DUF1028 domain-containing protein [Candidatus Sulfotelmatobacter sp.]|nr:DUF1028 domain-containing protein [Candidatus Sulfotelmatobacter sp.]